MSSGNRLMGGKDRRITRKGRTCSNELASNDSKHVEHISLKLEVENRHAAISLAFEAIRREGKPTAIGAC